MAKDSNARGKVSAKGVPPKNVGVSNGDKLDVLQKMFPIKNGMRLRTSAEKSNRNARGATLWLYIESSGQFELHETVFAKREGKNSAWWSRYFASKVFKGSGKNTDRPVIRMGVVDGAIMPGINKKTRQHWHVRAVIGYNLHDSVNALYPSIHRRGNKAKS
jgi:hypothetical protein